MGVEIRAGVVPYFIPPSTSFHSVGAVVGMCSPLNGQPEWLLPKGHIEEGESPIDAAMREAYEEMGVVGMFVGNGGIRISELLPLPKPGGYELDEPIILVPTLVIIQYFPMKVFNFKEAKSPEGRLVQWLDRKDAYEALTYPAHIEVVRRAYLQ